MTAFAFNLLFAKCVISLFTFEDCVLILFLYLFPTLPSKISADYVKDFSLEDLMPVLFQHNCVQVTNVWHGSTE